ncbi:MAG: methylmalonate-semialdehyde dehydrogenase (CoA acylating), partial [Candidatus Limnocylindria bacterium]
MTQVAEPRPEQRPAAVDRVKHWINGAPVAGTSGRNGPVYNPATGEVAREVDFASVEAVDGAGCAARGAVPAWR